MKELRCSSLHRFMQCVGSLDINNKLLQEAGQPAKDGTAFGELVTHMIEQDTTTPTVKPTAMNGVFFDKDMWFHATNMFKNLKERAQGNKITSEQRIDWIVGTTGDTFTIRGQYDSCFVVGDTLYVDDAKYGFGLVEAEENWQLLGYAIGKRMQLLQQGIYLNKIVLTIHQPRGFHENGPVRSWSLTNDELIAYYHKIVGRINDYITNSKTLTTGDSCKYCEAAANCPALNRAYHNALDVVLADYSDKTLTNEDIANIMPTLEKADEIIKIKRDSMKNLAISRIQNSQIIPGYGMVQKFGDRQWKAGITADTIKAMTGVNINEVVMMSPNKAEKAGVNKKMTAALTSKPSKGFDLGKIDIQQQADKLFNK